MCLQKIKDRVIENFFKNRYLWYIFPISLLIFIFTIGVLYSVNVLKTNHQYYVKSYTKEYMGNKQNLLKKDISFVIQYFIQNPQCKDKKKLIQKLKNIRYENDRYLFIFQYDQKTNSLKPIVNPNMPDSIMGKELSLDELKQKDGIDRSYIYNIVKTLQSSPSGFFEYKFKEPHSKKVSKKLSYVYFYEPLQWYIGTGIHISLLDQTLSEHMRYLEEDIKDLIYQYILLATVVTIILSILIYVILHYISNKQYNVNQYEKILSNIKNELEVYYWVCTFGRDKSLNCIAKSQNNLDHINSLEDILEHVVQNDFNEVKQFFELLLKEQNSKVTEFRISFDGEVHYYKCYCNFIFNQTTKTNELIIVLVDISAYQKTQLKMIDKQLIRIQNKIDKDFLDFINMIAHQWRHPISYINSKMIDLDIEPFDKKEFIKEIENTTEFLSSTIEDFFNIFSNQNSIALLDIAECLENVLKILKPKLIDIDIIKSYGNKPIMTVGSSTKLQQVLMIILKNSIDAFKNHEKSNKKIIIDIKVKQKLLIIKIEDNAGGADQFQLDRLFDMYYTTKHGENKGLGLYLAKLLVENFFFGKIKVKNYKDGFKNTISIPIREEETIEK